MTNRNENSAKPNCDSCHGRGVKRLVVGKSKAKGNVIREVQCHCVNINQQKNKVYDV